MSDDRAPSRNGGGSIVIAVASLVGLAAYLYPFLLPAVSRADERSARAGEAPLVLALVTAFCLIAITTELDGGIAGVSASKTVALLGVLVALDATLRLVPTVLGASPVFFLIIITGAVFGPAFGFQMGALTLLISAFITGGVGPWLPYQMLGAGWVGLTAGWLPRAANVRRRLLVLAIFGAGWGFLYGALLNLTTWPFAAPGVGADIGLYWSPVLSFSETIDRYARFYAVTSFGYDLFRAVGNAVLVLALGGPILRVMERFRARFAWEPWEPIERGAGGDVTTARP